MNELAYVTYLNELGIPVLDRESNGGRIPDAADYGTWMRDNDPIAFQVGFNEWGGEEPKKTVEYEGKQVEVIDCTPTWEGILPTYLLILRDANATGRKSAIEELTNMARTADAAVKMRKVLDEVDTALAVLAIGSDHGITPQAAAAIKEVTPKIQALLNSYKKG